MRKNTPAIQLNQNILDMEYAVRGPIPKRAAELERSGVRTIPCNIGNPQALGQKPITYYRQILSLVEHPITMATLTGDDSPFAKSYPADVRTTAEVLLQNLKTGTGAYTASNGPVFIREAVARFIDTRDRKSAKQFKASDPEKIFLTNGASEGAKYIIEMLISEPKDGIMIPIPQYPLYSATIRKAGGTQVNYYPDEDAGWTIDRATLEAAYAKALSDGVTVKCIVAINPGNPTGAILDATTITEIIEFAADRRIAIIADEVYQENVYGAEFHSFAGLLGGRDVPLFSLHSVSKGFYGECGHRGGYLEVRNAPPVAGHALNFLDVLHKMASVSLCSNTVGQILTYLMVTPPPEGSPSYAGYIREKNHILTELEDKARIITRAFSEMQGVAVFGRPGAMYLFPRLGRLPQGTTDFDYCMNLLETTGLCTVNGTGFGQAPGTSHLRIAFLPPKPMLEEVLPKWIAFHNSYVNR